MNHRIEGVLATNFGDHSDEDPREPAIEVIRTFWTGDVPGVAPLIVHGAEHLEGIWRRQGNEPDPVTFLVADPALRRRSTLWISVSVRGSITEFTSPLATFGDETGEVFKRLRSNESWFFVELGRTFNLRPNARSSHYSAVSVGGYPVPTSIFRDQLSVRPNIWREWLDVSAARGTHSVLDFFEQLPRTEGYVPIWQAKLHALTVAIPFPTAPDLHWAAELEPKPLDPVARELWRTFVDTADPSPERITLTGHEAP